MNSTDTEMACIRHYCYRIDFEDGFVYFGVRSCDCDPAEDTSYWGSPCTHAAKWLTDIPRVKTIVSEHATRELALKAEAKLIRDFWAVSKSLSLNAAIHNEKFSRQGVQLTEEQRAKLSAANTGKTHTDEARAKMSEANKGKPKTAEHRASTSAALKDKPKSAEHRAKLANAGKGRKASAASCAALSAAGKGRKWYTNGITSIRLKPGDAVPDGFRPGRTIQPHKQP